MSAWTWTPEEVAKRKAMLADPACLLDAKEMVLSLLDEIERLQAQVAELRERLMLQCAVNGRQRK